MIPTRLDNRARAARTSTLTLRLQCQRCQRPVTVLCRSAAPPERIRAHLWPCPHRGCAATNVIASRGEIRDCWSGHGQR